MTEQEFLTEFFKIAKTNHDTTGLTFENALEVFKAREDFRLRLLEEKDNNWNECRALGRELGEQWIKEQYKEQLEGYESIKDLTVKELIDVYCSSYN